MYNIAIYIYLIGVAIGSLFNKKIKKMWRGEREAVDLLKEKVDPTAKYVWFHAASLGEFEQGRPLIEQLRATHPEYKILLTFFSPSGYEVRKNYEGADIVCYLPLDTIRNARSFLRAVHPIMAFFIKYEFWYNYLHILRHRGVPVYSVSSIFRPGQVFFKWYGRNYAKVLHCITHFFVQNEISLQLLKGIGIDEATVVGDTRFDRVADVRGAAKEFPVIESFVANSSFTLVMGSSWQPDEDIVMPYFNEHPNMKLIVAPHEFDAARLSAIVGKTRRKAGLYSATNAENAAELDCLVIDCFGILSSLYRYGQMAYIGGGFGAGIHNINEAAVYGIPVVFGPKFGKFAEAHDLIAFGGGHCINNAQEFADLMDKMLNNPAALENSGNIAGNYISTHIGATSRIYRELFPKRRQ